MNVPLRAPCTAVPSTPSDVKVPRGEWNGLPGRLDHVVLARRSQLEGVPRPIDDAAPQGVRGIAVAAPVEVARGGGVVGREPT